MKNVFVVRLKHIRDHCQTNKISERSQDNYTAELHLIHSFIPSFIHPFIHSSVCFPSLSAVIYSVELERQGAEY